MAPRHDPPATAAGRCKWGWDSRGGPRRGRASGVSHAGLGIGGGVCIFVGRGRRRPRPRVTTWYYDSNNHCQSVDETHSPHSAARQESGRAASAPIVRGTEAPAQVVCLPTATAVAGDRRRQSPRQSRAATVWGDQQAPTSGRRQARRASLSALRARSLATGGGTGPPQAPGGQSCGLGSSS